MVWQVKKVEGGVHTPIKWTTETKG